MKKKNSKHIDFSALSDEDLARLARVLQERGHGTDTILAHINPEEAQLLKEHGGSGAINPDTGLMQFDGDGGGGDGIWFLLLNHIFSALRASWLSSLLLVAVRTIF